MYQASPFDNLKISKETIKNDLKSYLLEKKDIFLKESFLSNPQYKWSFWAFSQFSFSWGFFWEEILSALWIGWFKVHGVKIDDENLEKFLTFWSTFRTLFHPLQAVRKFTQKFILKCLLGWRTSGSFPQSTHKSFPRTIHQITK